MTDGISTTGTTESVEPVEAPKGTRQRMQIFRGADAPELGKDAMPFVGVDAGVMAGFAKLAAAQGGEERVAGEDVRVLFSMPGGGMSLCYSWFKSGYVLPRHSHNADCIYYILGGALRAGTQILRKGDGIFIPADFGYTFEALEDGVEFLECRNATAFNIHFKGNDEAHWDKMAASYRDNKDRWKEETVKPTDRVPA